MGAVNKGCTIMAQINYPQLLLILSLVPSFGAGLEISSFLTNSDSLALAESTVAVSPVISQVEPSLSKLNTTYQQFQDSLNNLLKELDKVAKDKRNADNAILRDTNAKLRAFYQAKLEFQANLQTSALPLPDNLIQISAEIDMMIQDLFQVIQPLDNGLKPENVRQIQEFLGFFAKRDISTQYYGIYGLTTQEEVALFLNGKNRLLEQKLNQLKQLLLPILALQGTSPSNQGNNAQIDTLIKQVEVLQQNNQKLQQQTNQLKYYLSFSLLVILLIMGSMFILLYKILITVEMNSNKSFATYNLTNNDLQIIEEEVLEKISQTLLFKGNHQDNFGDNENYLTSPKSSANHTNSNNQFYGLDESLLNQDIPVAWNDHTPHFVNAYDQLVESYNQNPQSLAEAETTIIANLMNNHVAEVPFGTTFFKKSNVGDYWIIVVDKLEYLVPKPNLKITETSYQSLECLFTCYGYKPQVNNQLKLLKPARVAATDEADTWELIQQGIVEFVPAKVASGRER